MIRQEKKKEEEPLDGDDSPKEKKEKKKKVGVCECLIDRGGVNVFFFVCRFFCFCFWLHEKCW